MYFMYYLKPYSFTLQEAINYIAYYIRPELNIKSRVFPYLRKTSAYADLDLATEKGFRTYGNHILLDNIHINPVERAWGQFGLVIKTKPQRLHQAAA